MDCMDCHNRPAHTFDPGPERAVDAAIARGQIPRNLPFSRREAVAALQLPFESRPAAMAGIERAMREAYPGRGVLTGPGPHDRRLSRASMPATCSRR